MTFADKISNIHQLTKEQYDQLIMNSITSNYKKANNSIKNQINMAVKNFVRDKEIMKRMETNEDNNRFITTKVHKENFDNHSAFRLIHPAEKELRRIRQIDIRQNQQKSQPKTNSSINVRIPT